MAFPSIHLCFQSFNKHNEFWQPRPKNKLIRAQKIISKDWVSNGLHQYSMWVYVLRPVKRMEFNFWYLTHLFEKFRLFQRNHLTRIWLTSSLILQASGTTNSSFTSFSIYTIGASITKVTLLANQIKRLMHILVHFTYFINLTYCF